MADEKDFNEVLDDIFLGEEKQHSESYEEGFQAGSRAGNPEGYHLGYHRGAEIGRELGYYQGIVEHHLEINDKNSVQYSDKIVNQLKRVRELICLFPRSNSEEHDIIALLETIRAQYKKTCALLKIQSSPSTMESTSVKVKQQLDRTWSYLQPMLTVANCHMVEFYTKNHWESFIPEPLRIQLEKLSVNDAVDKFWSIAGDWKNSGDECELGKFIRHARSHCVQIDSEICLSVDEFKHRVQTTWGGHMQPEIPMKEFMSSKKAYEVRTMSPLVSSLLASAATHVVDAGGGRGALASTLSSLYGARALVLDCDTVALSGGEYRDRILKKKMHSVTRSTSVNNNPECNTIKEGSHRYVEAFMTEGTDLCELVRENFPEDAQTDVKILLTGLHTCGGLGASSLRQFVSRPGLAALFTVPCCYHLLAEPDHFPLSTHFNGVELGRNARMLAAQSLERVTSLRQLPAASLHYRALLEVIITKHLCNSRVAEGRLKRLSKCQNFTEYFRAADDILNLQVTGILTNNYLTQLDEMYDKKKLVLFYLLRMCLAQVIESVILLDRLLFLYENGHTDVFLIKIFDPVMSPRCYAIVAVR